MLKNLYGEKRTIQTQQELNAVLLAHERYVSYRGGVRAQLAHSQLDNLVLANRNLSDADFSGASLVGANLYGSNLERASLYCADLRDCDLRSARLMRADLRGASFKGAQLAHAVLDHADLRAAMMMYVDPTGISVVDRERGEGVKGSASGVDFTNCSLKGVSFGNAKLDGADFTGANLQGANFKNAKLTNVTFRNAILTGVNMRELQVPKEALAGCISDVTPAAAAKFDRLKVALEAHQLWVSSVGAQGAPANLDGEDLRPLHQLMVGRLLSGISAKGANCIGLDFSGSHLQAAKFDGTDLRDANFTGADLRGASLRSANLGHAHFTKAKLGRLPLTDGSSLAPDLTGALACTQQFCDALLEDELVAMGLVPQGLPTPLPGR